MAAAVAASAVTVAATTATLTGSGAAPQATGMLSPTAGAATGSHARARRPHARIARVAAAAAAAVGGSLMRSTLRPAACRPSSPSGSGTRVGSSRAHALRQRLLAHIRAPAAWQAALRRQQLSVCVPAQMPPQCGQSTFACASVQEPQSIYPRPSLID
jgi:hypothetical protein